MKQKVSCLAALAGLVLGLAPQALAATIEVTGTSAWSTLGITASDDVVIRNNGILVVDVQATGTPPVVPGARSITIGDAATPGTLRFASGNDRSIAVVTNVVFGSHPNNLLDMEDAFGVATHRLAINGHFLQTGAGTFRPGLGTVVFQGNDQAIPGQVAGQVARFNNLVLTGAGTKTVQPGVTVLGTLSVYPGITIAGTQSVAYEGTQARLQYVGNTLLLLPTTINVTSIEWPANLPAAVQLTTDPPLAPEFPNGVRVALDGNKTVTRSLTIGANCTLDLAGFILSVRGAVANNGNTAGAGNIELAGTSSQALSGTGMYGNLRLNNSAGATIGSSTLRVAGRLSLANGRLTLAGNLSTAALLSIGGVDRPNAGTYGSSSSPAGFPNDDYFAGTGILTLSAKPAPAFYVGKFTNDYGTASLVITGAVSRASGESYGNAAVVGDSVSVTIQSSPISLVRQVQVSDNQGRFSAQFDTSTLQAGSYTVQYLYAGGINLASGSAPQAGGVVIQPLRIVVTPNNQQKLYGTTDPPLTFTTDRALVPGDGFTGSLSRVGANQPPGAGGSSPAGEQRGSYEIIRGTLNLPASYDLQVTAGRTLEILPQQVQVLALAASKNYGNDDPAPLPYNWSPPTLRFNDQFQGTLARDAGDYVGNYAIRQGSLVIVSPGTGNTNNYAITYTPNTFTINPRPVTIGLAAGASSGKIYGQANPARYAPTFAPSPLPYGDKDDPETSLARAAGENAGPYAISLGNLRIISATGNTNKTANYVLNVPASLNYVISKRDARLSASGTSAAPRNVPYGDNPTSNLVKYEYKNDAGEYVPWPTGSGAPALPATPPSISNWAPNEPAVGSMPGDYTYRVNKNAADPNYNIAYAPTTTDNFLPGLVRIVKKEMRVVADSKTKIEDGIVFPASQYTVSYNPPLAAGDTPATAFTGGGVTYGGSSQTATQAGVYPITLTGNLTSDKYTILGYDPGSLVITEAIGTEEVTGTETWGPGGTYSWTINQANGGTAGASPGWKLLRVKKTTGGAGGNLNITATTNATGKFTIYLSTLIPGPAPAAGPAAKFDPTRPYRWKIAEAEASIDGFDPAKFNIVSSGGGMFANNVFGGTFSLEAPGRELFVVFTPAAQGSLSDENVTNLLNAMLASDLDTLYLESSSYSVTPQQTVTISLNVGNLKQPVFGAQAYLRFSSAHFVATQTGAGSPVVTPGGGVWDTAIFQLWNAGGDLDTVVLLNIGSSGGTVSPGTVARITLTPNRTLTGDSHIVFRLDSEMIQPGGAFGGTYLTAAGGVPVLPARVQSKKITIPGDEDAPKINSIAATQVQYGNAVNVRNPSLEANVDSPRVVRGNVNLVVNVTDLHKPGVGLAGPPTVTFYPTPSGTPINATTNTTGSADGDFSYTLPITKDTANGRWNFQVTATDRLGKVTSSVLTENYIIVNKNQVEGIVQLDGFRGTSRAVTFTAGNGSSIQRTWNLNIATGDPKFLAQGEFSDLPGFAKELVQPSAAVQTSAYLRYGVIGSLENLLIRILEGPDNFAAYMRDTLFGYFIGDLPEPGITDFHTQVALRLKAPQRSIDSYIRGRLPLDTINLLNAYPVAITNVTLVQFQTLNNALLIDFNDIVMGPNIWDPLRFASVQPPVRTEGNPVDQILDRIEDNNPDNNPSAREIQQLNRMLLAGAYLPYRYGGLSPETAQRMVQYAGGGDNTLVGLLLLDFDTLTQPVSDDLWGADSLYTEERFLGIPLRSATSQLVVKLINEGLNNADLVRLNRLLIEDGVAFSLSNLNYRSGALRPETAAALSTFLASQTQVNKAALEPLLVTDLEAVRTAGVITRPQFEAAYPAQIIRAATRGTYTLINVPDGVTLVAAKAAWNLRVKRPWTASGSSDPTLGLVYFVTGSNVRTPGPASGDPILNYHLRAGDIFQDGTSANRVDLGDFGLLQVNYGTVFPAADVDGSGVVDSPDYSLQRRNFNAVGDADVNVP